MCGIIGIASKYNITPLLLEGLHYLEYRGYDSAGIALLNGETCLYKQKGKVSDLENHIADQPISGNIGIGHTRWATHGEPSDLNAHPHQSEDGLRLGGPCYG